MPLLLHFLSKQIFLAVLTGNTTTSESWKSVCNIYLKHLCEELSVKKVQSTPLCFLVAAIYHCSRAPERIAPHQKKDNVRICPSARGLFAPSVPVRSLNL